VVIILTMKTKKTRRTSRRLDAEAIEKAEIAADLRLMRAARRADRGKPVVTIQALSRQLGLR
jgi:hypothetical protein